MRSKNRVTLCLVMLCSMISTLSWAQKPQLKRATYFDKNHDGLIDKSEAKELFRHLVGNDPTRLGDAAKPDKNGDGAIDATEAQLYTEEFEQRVQAGLDDYSVVLDPEEFERQHYPHPAPKRTFPIFVRAAATDLPVSAIMPKRDPDSDFKKSAPALASYSRNFKANADTWQAKGAILWPLTLVEERLFMLTSAAFNRLSTQDPDQKKTEADELTPRLALEYEGGPAWLLDMQFIRPGVTIATDFDFDMNAQSFDLEWEPVVELLGNGSEQWVPLMGRLVGYRLRNVLHYEVGSVKSTGGKPGIAVGDFGRLGPLLQIDLFPAFLESTTVNASWQYYAKVSGELGDSRLLRLGLSIAFGKLSHFSLTAQYENGCPPLLTKDTETLAVGLGFKY